MTQRQLTQELMQELMPGTGQKQMTEPPDTGEEISDAIEDGIDDGIEDPDLAQYEDAQHRGPCPIRRPTTSEGELQIRRPPGVRAGPYPDIQIIVTATTEHLAAARLHTAGPPPRHPGWTDPLDLDLGLNLGRVRDGHQHGRRRRERHGRHRR